MGKSIDLTGQVRERLTIIKKDYSIQKGKGVYWICKCSCGNIISVNSSSLSWKKSCGCLNTETRKKNAKNMGKLNKQNLKNRFFQYVDKTDSCWNWTGDIGISGYGRFWYNGKTVNAHRLSYQKYKGKIPKGLLVCHTCDNPKCVNPNHLFLGTNQDNMTDRNVKSRQAKGSKIGNSKLTESCVISIIDMLNKNAPSSIIAQQFRVSWSTIDRIKKRVSWKHIPR